jgi:hypothetical protein
MQANLPNHEPSLMLMNCGDQVMSRPSVGSWIIYGLGTENQNLPGFITLCPNGLPVKESENWQSGFLPGVYQGTYVDSQHTQLEKLIENIRNDYASRKQQRRQLDLLQQLNQEHQQRRQQDARLESRLQSFELAYRMQTTAADVVDLTKEDQKTKEMYGLTNPQTADFGKKCLVTRRLLEKGVRFVQLYSGGSEGTDANWDGHNDCIANHKLHAAETDQPIAALIHDLKRTGLWEETLLFWGGEFGRTPTSEGVGKTGRDHNWYGFSMWVAGAGVKGGQAVGATDELGFKAVEDRCHVSDLHATILQLMGFDHTKLTYFYHGLNERLTGQRGNVMKKVLA